MGNPLFGVDISGLIHKNISPGVNDATLIQVASGSRTGGQLTGGTNPTTTSYACKGFIDMLDKNSIEATLVDVADALVQLIGDSIAVVPAQGDRITILGTTFNILDVKTDPAQAVYACTCKTE